MKVAILNDTHCGVRNSSDIFLNYAGRFYKEVFFFQLHKIFYQIIKILICVVIMWIEMIVKVTFF